jgi:NAD-dependent SIR2 family protein deacetylase
MTELVKSWIKESNRIIILSGAGVSTNAGIPDYRSAGKNVVLERGSSYVAELTASAEQAQPTISHSLPEWLAKQGKLVRVYTQNIDGLYRKTTLPKDRLVEFHGCLADDTVVYFDDPIPPVAIETLKKDFVQNSPDLIIVMGTSLKVKPFALIPNMVPLRTKRVLITLNVDELDCIIGPDNPYETYGLYSYKPTARIAGMLVSAGPTWTKNDDDTIDHGVWKSQKVIEMDCDEFSRTLMED